MKKIDLYLTDEEDVKLRKLAAHHGCSPAEALRRFIRTCQPGGSGWLPPGMAPKPVAENAS